MTLNEAERIKKMLEETEHASSKLKNINDQLRLFYDRLEILVKHHRRKMPIRDLTFQEEFRACILELRNFTNECEDFWQETRRYYQTCDKTKFVQENRINIKQIKTAALSFNRQVDELYTVFKNLSYSGKELPLRLNWWLFEASSNDLTKITSHILFLIRDMEKRYE